MKLRKFEILDVKFSAGGNGSDYGHGWIITYKAIKNKKWVNDTLFVIAPSEKLARDKAIKRFGGIE